MMEPETYDLSQDDSVDADVTAHTHCRECGNYIAPGDSSMSECECECGESYRRAYHNAPANFPNWVHEDEWGEVDGFDADEPVPMEVLL